MKAVNLIPDDSRGGWRSAGSRSGGSVYVLLGTLAVALALVTVYVLTVNRVSDQRAKIAELQTQATQAQSAATRLAPYVDFAALAQSRAETVREIALSRFDWQAALAGLSRVVPANTSLQSLVGTAPSASTTAPSTSTATTTATSTAASAAATAAATGPSFALSGCSDSQDDVARLISRLRLIDGVTQVSLGDTQKSASAQSGASVSSSSGSGGCPAGSPSFSLVISFEPVATGTASAITSSSAQPVSTTAGTGASR